MVAGSAVSSVLLACALPAARALRTPRITSLSSGATRHASDTPLAPSAFGNHQGGRTVRGAKKVRHHVNPLTAHHSRPLSLAEGWLADRFDDPSLPLHLDIGSARGLFALDLAETDPTVNVLGLEVRPAMAEAADADARQLGLGNCAFLRGNANAVFEQVAEIVAAGAGGESSTLLRSVSIQFPDPWFKARHHKRRGACVRSPRAELDLRSQWPS